MNSFWVPHGATAHAVDSNLGALVYVVSNMHGLNNAACTLYTHVVQIEWSAQVHLCLIV